MRRNSLKVNATLNAIKQCCSILFPLITFPYVSRILGSDGYGKYSFSNTMAYYFILIAGLGISTYAIREGAKIRDDQRKLNDFCSNVFSINVFSAVFAYLALFIVLAVSDKIGSYAVYIIIQSLTIILSLFGRDWINSIFEDYFYLTVRYIVIHCLAIVAMFIFVRTSEDLIAYCLISVLAVSGGNIANVFYVKRYAKVRFTLKIEWKKHLPPLLILFVNSIAVIIYVNADITMLGFFYNDSLVGIYSVAVKIYNLIKQLVNAMVVVSLPRLSYVLSNAYDEYKNYIGQMCMMVSIVLFPLVIGLFFMSDSIILIAGGSQYLTGKVSLMILSIALIFAILSSIFTNGVLISNRQEKKCLVATSVSAVINIGLNIFILPIWGIAGAAFTTVISEATNFIMQMYFSRKYFKISELEFKPYISVGTGCFAILVICICCNLIFANMILKLIIAMCLSGIAYLVILIKLRNPMALEMVTAVKNKMRKS